MIENTVENKKAQNNVTEEKAPYHPPTGDVVIRLRQVSKTYRLFKTTTDLFLNVFIKRPHKQIKALKNVNLDIHKGEVLGLIGLNGCGKSTLLKVIAGIVVPDYGSEVETVGTLGTMISLGSGFVSELSGRENIMHRAELMGIAKADIEKKVDSIIDFSDLGDRIDDIIKTYSSGMKARLGFAFYAFIEPDIMIVDEITAVGDKNFKEKARKTIFEMFQSGKTIIFVSHNLAEIQSYCSRAAVMKSGKVMEIGDPDVLVEKYQKGEYEGK